MAGNATGKRNTPSTREPVKNPRILSMARVHAGTRNNNGTRNTETFATTAAGSVPERAKNCRTASDGGTAAGRCRASTGTATSSGLVRHTCKRHRSRRSLLFGSIGNDTEEGTGRTRRGDCSASAQRRLHWRVSCSEHGCEALRERSVALPEYKRPYR